MKNYESGKRGKNQIAEFCPESDLGNYGWLCDYLMLKPGTARLKVHKGEIPHIKIGALVRFRKADIDAHLAARTKAVK